MTAQYVAVALSSFLSPDGADQREAVIARRIDRLTHQFDLLERDQMCWEPVLSCL